MPSSAERPIVMPSDEWFLDLENLRQDLGAWIASHIETKKLLRKDIAEALGNKDPSIVSHVLSGRHVPHPDEYEKWAKALQLTKEEAGLLRQLLARAKAMKCVDNGADLYIEQIEDQLLQLDLVAREVVRSASVVSRTLISIINRIESEPKIGIDLPSSTLEAVKGAEELLKRAAQILGARQQLD